MAALQLGMWVMGSSDAQPTFKAAKDHVKNFLLEDRSFGK